MTFISLIFLVVLIIIINKKIIIIRNCRARNIKVFLFNTIPNFPQSSNKTIFGKKKIFPSLFFILIIFI
jgi:hypothetical protein